MQARSALAEAVGEAAGCRSPQWLAAITASGDSISRTGIIMPLKRAANGMQYMWRKRHCCTMNVTQAERIAGSGDSRACDAADRAGAWLALRRLVEPKITLRFRLFTGGHPRTGTRDGRQYGGCAGGRPPGQALKAEKLVGDDGLEPPTFSV